MRKALPFSTHVLYVPRAKNQLADWLSKVGGAIQDEVQLADLEVELVEDGPPPKQWKGKGEHMHVCTPFVGPMTDCLPIVEGY